MAEIIKSLKIITLASVFAMICASTALAGDLPRIHGFAENSIGVRVTEDGKTNKRGYNMLEQRMRFKLSYYPDEIEALENWNTEIMFKADILADEYTEKFSFNIRELYAFFSPLSFIDLKIGEQVLTWGTGDYMFVNDLFPKDYVSFLIGRDDEYLKRPSYAGRATFFSRIAAMDVVVIPFFTPNKIVKGDRLSFYDPLRGGIVGRVSDRQLLEPPTQFENTEIAARLYGTFRSYEWAGYYFHGFYKNPMGYKEELNSQLYYPQLDVYGGSVRGPIPFIGGIGNVELGYYDSKEDTAGKDRLIPNPGIKYLAGYKKAFKHDFEIGVQYFVEQMLYYDNYKESLLNTDSQDDAIYQQLTLRLTKLMANQTLRLSCFVFYSPVDNDIYARPVLVWDATDKWKISLGGNIFLGKQTNADYGQYVGNNNIYMRVRYSF